MVKIVFSGDKKKAKGGVDVEELDAGRVDVGLSTIKPKPKLEPLPEAEPLIPPEPPVDGGGRRFSPVNAEVEFFKNNYLNTFGMDSLIPSSGEVLRLNLLFAIWRELKVLNDKFDEE